MKRLAAVSIALASALIGPAFVAGGGWIGAAAGLGFGVLWLIGVWRGWQAADTLGLAGFAGLASAGVWLGYVAPLLLAGLVAALAGWDLSRFARRLAGAGRVEGLPGLVRAHLRRLLAALGLGLLLGLAALEIQITLSFAAALLLAACAILGLSRAVRALGQTRN